ncbi:GDSL-type esterase/lipase family protein [Micromonospora sp. WMMA1363]|uniref:GDSL-type esterase/lipase family protein n=1 Tax=Micromonospora sp. WMMA1363 TaxID=3053985 RepID=UPI00259C75A1|nr:GDSL-type esterase/lipase family protein [Micromonospora sp. WMMA1363]MDM4718349.1 GDSL-type esterase/lipase family protein [Micromonospora sp. WMMA1363]
MPRRWVATAACLLALVALACESGDDATPRPTRSAAAGAGGIAALGDSITTGFGSCLVLTSCQRNSWSTGNSLRVDSHYRRLLDQDSAVRGRAYNHARPGARAEALAGQAERAVRDKPERVTVLIGANDACRGGVEAMTPVKQFRTDVDRGLRVLRTKRPKARVLVVSIPDLYRLWEVGHTNERAVRAWRRGVCPALLANPTSTDPLDQARRDTVRKRIDAYNGQLAAACRAYGSRCRYDGGAAHRVRFTLDLVNPLDSFHPNAAGQDKLAEVTWRAWGRAT